MWFTKQQNGFRAWFAVKTSGGTLRTGLVSSSFVATVRNPADTTGSVFPVTQSGMPGLYRFDVTPAFLMSGGYGEYGAVVEINTTGPVLRDVFTNVLRVTREDFDSLSSSLASSIWDEPNGLHVISGSTGDSLMSASISVAISASVSVDNAAIADAVWDEAINGHLTSGSTGWVLDRLDRSVQSVSGTISQMSGTLSQLYNVSFGRWRITANQMIFYADDNSTEIARFNLFDDVGSPSMDAVFERVKV